MLSRLTLTHLLVGLASVVLAACLSSYLFGVLYVTQRRSELLTATQAVADASGQLIAHNHPDQLPVLASAAAEMLGGRVCILPTVPGVASVSSFAGTQVSDLPAHECEQAEASQGPLWGTELVACQGPTYSMTAPIRAPASGDSLGEVLVRCPIAGVNRIVSAQWLSAAAAAIGAALVALLLGLTVSRTLSAPLRRISDGAERLARGDFGVRVEPRGPREVASLARTINWSADRLAELFTELSSERSRLADVLGSMSEGVLAYDGDGRLLFVNGSARQLLGLPDGEPSEWLLDSVVTESTVLEVLRGGGVATVGGAEHRTLRVRTADLTGGAGRVAVILDITDAERLDRTRREFIANASHQLRTPLTSIRGYLEALSDGTADTPERRARCVAVALDQVALFQNLVDQLLELSKLQSQPHPIEFSTVSLAEVSERARAHMLPQAQRQDVSLLGRIEGEPPPVVGDPDLLLQAVQNMVDNAIRVSVPGSEVRVTVSPFDGQVELRVEDRGPGLPDSEPDLLWERFYSGKCDGTAGLGLAITREIVQAHGGTVFARPRDGGGAVFGFTVPVAQ
jgi:signal transduction histidine kinase